MSSKYPHLAFKRRWSLTPLIHSLLGQCDAFVQALTNTPILPEINQQLLRVSLRKGAQATTAIEGNTLTDDEILQIEAGESIAPSKEYQARELTNIIDAFNTIFNWMLEEERTVFIDTSLILTMHKLVGKELGEHFNAIPGKFREDARVVGRYRCPRHEDVQGLVKELVDWLPREFGFGKGQTFQDAVIEAMVCHVYIEWIHPFGDGNGRTGRLLEFYVLCRWGFPNIASHLLSNHYNVTRFEYYRLLDKARTDNDLTQFIEYALLGLRDGLKGTLEGVQQSQRDTTWQKHIYDLFDAVPNPSSIVSKRRRSLILQLPVGVGLTSDQIALVTPEVAVEYATKSKRTLQRDLEALVSLGLLARDDNVYLARIESIGHYNARRRRIEQR
ncbi:MAG: Fic family protein, partial [Rhodothermia bacterium]